MPNQGVGEDDFQQAGTALECVAMNGRIRALALIVTLCGAGSLGVMAQTSQAPSPPAATTDNPAPKKAKHVYTNDDIAPSPEAGKGGYSPSAGTAASKPAGPKLSAEQVRANVHKQKARIAQEEAQRDRLQRLVAAAPNSDCSTINTPTARQRDRCSRVARMADQLKQAQSRVEKEKATLASMQDAARKMGYGSAVYDAN